MRGAQVFANPQSTPMQRLVSTTPFTLLVKNSRFLAELLPVENQEDARKRLAEQKAKYEGTGAGHVVHALVIGPQANILGCSDAGEPAGTAGRPVLEVLKGADVTDVLLTVTRWFGGIKLGTGGLVKAYSESAQGVLAQSVFQEIVAMHRSTFLVPFACLESAKRLLSEAHFTIQQEEYGAEGDCITGEIAEADAPALAQRLRDLSRGKIQL